jgi:uncharacterized protein YraI/lysophospholipase L1-like esterase
VRILLPILLLLLSTSVAWAQPFQERYRTRVAQFERENRQLSSASRSVVLFGSSSMEGWKNGRRIQRFLPNIRSRVRNRGISGDGIGIKATTGLYNRIQASVTGAHPTHVFVLNGRNSIGYGAQRVANRYREVVAEIRRTSPDAVITIVSCAPVRKSYTHMKDKVVALNRRLRSIAQEQGALFFDLHARLVDSNGLMKRALTNDGLHFKDEGYRILGAEIERIVREDVRPDPPVTPTPTPTTPTPTPTPASTSETRQVAANGLNLRRGPGSQHAILTTLRRGTRLEVLARQGAWLEVRAGSRQGWLHGAFTSPLAASPAPSAQGTHRVTATRLNVRRGAGLDQARLGSFPRGTELQVLSRDGLWWEVQAGSRRGWVHSGYVERIPQTGISGAIN